MIIYRVDSYANIVWVNDHFKEFAVENGAAALADEVIGTKLRDHISGMEVLLLWVDLLKNVTESQKTVEIPFRCDSPDTRRFMQMRVIPLPDQHVEIQCRVLRIENRQPMNILSPSVPRSRELLTICAWCRRVKNDRNNWVELEDAIREGALFEAEMPPCLTHGVCPSCFDLLMSKLGSGGSSLAGTKP